MSELSFSPENETYPPWNDITGKRADFGDAHNQ